VVVGSMWYVSSFLNHWKPCASLAQLFVQNLEDFNHHLLKKGVNILIKQRMILLATMPFDQHIESSEALHGFFCF